MNVEDDATCRTLEPQLFYANAHPSREDGDVESEREASFTGVVERITSPFPSSSNGGGLGKGGPERGYTLRVLDGMEPHAIVLALPWRAPIASAGDTISVRYAVRNQELGPTDGFVEVRDEDGLLTAWVAQSANGLSGLEVPAELVIAEGEACDFDEGHGAIVRHDLHVTSGGSDVDLGFGETAEVGDFVVMHGEDTDTTAVQINCDDCFTAHSIIVAALRGSRASLDARDASFDPNAPDDSDAGE